MDVNRQRLNAGLTQFEEAEQVAVEDATTSIFDVIEAMFWNKTFFKSLRKSLRSVGGIMGLGSVHNAW
jgi:hypothetical protein